MYGLYLLSGTYSMPVAIALIQLNTYQAAASRRLNEGLHDGIVRPGVLP